MVGYVLRGEAFMWPTVSAFYTAGPILNKLFGYTVDIISN